MEEKTIITVFARIWVFSHQKGPNKTFEVMLGSYKSQKEAILDKKNIENNLKVLCDNFNVEKVLVRIDSVFGENDIISQWNTWEREIRLGDIWSNC